MNYNKYKTMINNLKNANTNKKTKMLRNLRMYEYDTHLTFDDLNNYQSVGYYWNGEASSAINENVIRSCVDTLVSKIASQKVRPFFNSVNGSWKDFQICTQAQQYFDILFDSQKVNNTVTLAFKDACIFERGFILTADKIERMLPWNVYTNPAEDSYNKNTELLYECVKYPVALLPEDIKTGNYMYVTYTRYWNIKEKVFYTYIPELNYNKLDTWEKELPFCTIYYNQPLFGSSASSICDILFGIQMQIDSIMLKTSEAIKRNPAQTFFVPEGTTIKASQINNEIGNVIQYRPIPGQTGGVPITSSTPGFIDPQYQTTLNQLKQDAYELVGISQLSASSVKPAGLNSGVALNTMENIESDRFETQLNSVIACYVDIAKKCIEIYDPNDDILPKNNKRTLIKWRDIIKASENFNIQYSAAESLSKDPSTKLQQLQSLAQVGIIPATHIAKYMELPDIESAYNITANALNACMSIIKETMESETAPVVPPYIPLPMLKEEVCNMMLSLRGANYEENKEDIDKLMVLYEQCTSLEDSMQPVTEEPNEALQDMDIANTVQDSYTI